VFGFSFETEMIFESYFELAFIPLEGNKVCGWVTPSLEGPFS
jgi:hypothetical protein